MLQTNSRFLFVASGQAGHGIDHLARSLILAQALADCGGACTFMATPENTQRLNGLAPAMARTTSGGDTSDDICKTAARVEYDAVIIDHPGLGRTDHEAMAKDRPSVILDDVADREIGGRIVVNPALTSDPANYKALAPDGAEILTGPIFALMSSEYAQQRLGRVFEPGSVRRLLLSVDADTPTDLTVRMVDHLRPRLGDATLEVLLPEEFEGRRGLDRISARDPRLTLNNHPLERPRIAARADLAISVLGPGLWEASALGLPLIAVAVRPSDKETANRLAELEAAICIDSADPNFEGRLERAFVRLVADLTLRARLSANSAALTDGTGASRIAQKLIELLPR
jgi:spore coat polysaccharide biosynthesis predicted glycosyltransferase SpsG